MSGPELDLPTVAERNISSRDPLIVFSWLDHFDVAHGDEAHVDQSCWAIEDLAISIAFSIKDPVWKTI